MINYTELYCRLSWRKLFMYIDTADYLADQLFIQQKVRIRFKREYAKKNCKYIMVVASCKAKEWEKARTALESLGSKMIISGYKDYEDYCEGLIKAVEEERDKRLRAAASALSK